MFGGDGGGGGDSGSANNTPTNENPAGLLSAEGGGASSLRRSSSGMDLDSCSGTAAGGVALGTLHCTVKYCFDKNALIVTVNKCQNLPAKDPAAKSRFVTKSVLSTPNRRQDSFPEIF